MLIAFRLLIVLLAAMPVSAIADGATTRDVIALVAAVMLAIAAMAPQADIKTTVQLLRRFSLALLFPVLWMALQIVPLPLALASIVNPIWSNTSIALNESSLWGHISLDPGNTLRSLILYATVFSLMVVTIVVTRDRQRAETTLFVLSAVTTFMSVEVLLSQLHSFAGIIPKAGSPSAIFLATSALGTLLNTAVTIRTVERHLGRRESENSPYGPLFFNIFLSLAGIALCLTALSCLASKNVATAMVFGLATMVFIVIVRRFAFPPWLSGLLSALFAAMALGVIALRFQGTAAPGMLRFATLADSESLTLAQRILSDSRWLGSGAGTFRSLAAIYRDFGATPILQAPTTAVSVAIEWGQPALLILIAFAIQLFVFLFLGALRRGRDSFFPSAAAASVAVLVCEAFCDSSLMDPTVEIIAVVLIGLGLSQSLGRTSGLQT